MTAIVLCYYQKQCWRRHNINNNTAAINNNNNEKTDHKQKKKQNAHFSEEEKNRLNGEDGKASNKNQNRLWTKIMNLDGIGRHFAAREYHLNI